MDKTIIERIENIGKNFDNIKSILIIAMTFSIIVMKKYYSGYARYAFDALVILGLISAYFKNSYQQRQINSILRYLKNHKASKDD